MPTYREYPKVLHHPAEAPATLGTRMGQGTPIRFPPVTVHTPGQEEEYVAKGYEAQGTGSAAAFWNATQAPTVPVTHHEYPKWAGGVLVNDEDEEIAALEAAEAAAQAPPEPVAAPDPYGDADTIRAALTARAEARGVRVDRRWSLERLIAEANGAGHEEAA